MFYGKIEDILKLLESRLAWLLIGAFIATKLGVH